MWLIPLDRDQLAGLWTEFIHGHVWSFNQPQTWKSRADVKFKFKFNSEFIFDQKTHF